MVKYTVRSNWPASWSMLRVRITRLPAGTARLPRMSAGGWPALTIDFIAVVAGVRCTTVPSGILTLWIVKVGVPPEDRADPTTPRTTMKTASPSTMRAGPRAEMGWNNEPRPRLRCRPGPRRAEPESSEGGLEGSRVVLTIAGAMLSVTARGSPGPGRGRERSVRGPTLGGGWPHSASFATACDRVNAPGDSPFIGYLHLADDPPQCLKHQRAAVARDEEGCLIPQSGGIL